jgi:hypothetical protein
MSFLSIFRRPAIQDQELTEFSPALGKFYDLQKAFQKYETIAKDDPNFESMRSEIFSIIYKIYIEKYPKCIRLGFDQSAFLKDAENSTSSKNQRIQRTALSYQKMFVKVKEEMLDFSAAKERQVVEDIFDLSLAHLAFDQAIDGI